MRLLLFLPAVMFFLLAWLGGMHQSRKQEEKEQQRQINKSLDRCNSVFLRGLETQSLKVCRDCILELQAAVVQQRALNPNAYCGSIIKDITDLKNHLHELEEEHWLKKAEKHLHSFSEYYELIMSDDLQTFNDVEKLFQAKKKCLDEWHKYFAIELEDYEKTIYPKRYLKEFMGEDYDPCMESSVALDKYLSEHIQTMRPEYKRKMQLYDMIVDYVASHPDIARSDLIKVSFNGFTQQEVSSCYRGLIDKRRLTEIKIGSRYFVILTDKELQQHGKTKRNDATEVREQTIRENTKEKGDSMIDSKSKVLYKEVIQHLTDKGAEYIDKTPQGGGLYFFDENIANELTAKGYKLWFAENGTRGTKHRPAWYFQCK